jgi:predicted N-acyltransferase
LAYQGELLVGALTADVMDSSVPCHYHLQRILEGDCDRIAAGIPPWKSPIDLMPAMLATNRAARLCDIRFHQDISPDQQRSVIDKLISALEQEGKRQDAKAAVLLHIPTNAHVIASVLEQAGYTRACIDAHPYLPITFPDLEGYLQIFSHGQRNTIRREMKAFNEDHSISIEKKTLAEGIDGLLTMVDYNFKKRHVTYNPDQYRSRIYTHIEIFKDNVFVLEMRWHGKHVASCFLILYKDCLYGRQIGIHPDVPKNLFPYFNLNYQSIQQAINLHCKRLIIGPGLEETKISRGCTLELTDMYVKTESLAVQERMQEIDGFMKNRFASWEALRARLIKSPQSPGNS